MGLNECVGENGIVSHDCLPILSQEQAILHQAAIAIADPTDPQIQTLITAMFATVHASNGVGLAAPQVGHSLQLIIVASHPNPRYPNAPDLDPFALINPQILAHSEAVVPGWEGCLSVPEVRGIVPRWQWVQVAYCDRHGQPHCHTYDGFVARIIQHELDHLQGILFTEHLAPGDRYTETDYLASVNSSVC
jgi:peptide deformylase